MLGKTAAENEVMQERLAGFGVASNVMDAAAVERRWPVLSTAPYAGFDYASGEELELPPGMPEFSALHEEGCGHLDSSSCLQDMLACCERDGIEVRFNAAVERADVVGGRVTGVSYSSTMGGAAGQSSTIATNNVVNCLGPWFASLSSEAGVQHSTTMLPTRIQVAHRQLPDDDDRYLDLPFVASSWHGDGIYFMPRRANRQLVFGSVAHRFESEIVDPDDCNPALDPDFKQDYLNCLLHRLPQLPQRGEIIGFSSMYTVNQDDVHPVVGEAEEVQGFYVCNGFSGHGFKLAPAVGSMLAQLITGKLAPGGQYDTTAPLDFLRPQREPLVLKTKTHFA